MLLNLWVIALLVLMIGGAWAGGAGATWAGQALGLDDLEPALAAPVGIAGIAVGGMTGLGIAIGVRALPHVFHRGTAAQLIVTCVAATAIGAVLYLAVIGGLVVLAGLVLPETPTQIIAVILSFIGLPVCGPIAYQLMTGRRADEVGGGKPLPSWVYRIRRRRRQPSGQQTRP